MVIADFRSDTLTKPTQAMLEAMWSAPVGDDVFGEDPTVNALEKFAAELFSMEAAIFCPSGTMSNQIAIKAHTQPGDEVICDHQSHVYLYEGGGIAFHSGCQVQLIRGDRGRITASQIREVLHEEDVHKPQTRLVSLENTANRGGGSCYSMETIREIAELCKERNLSLHLDGARLFNAMVALSQDPVAYGKIFDSISICLNKGLGCPIGSILLGRTAFIKKARRIRKVMGGGMRQAGFMAAAGLYALKNNIKRLEQDHRHAQTIAASLQKKKWCAKLYPVETNIILFETESTFPAAQLVKKLENNGIRAIAMSQQLIRLVVHLDITEEMVLHTVRVLESLDDR
jgi:threonine aldolase